MKYIQPDWPAPAQIKAYTTLRQGWNSSLPYQGKEFTEKLVSLLQLPAAPCWLTQIHSNIAIEATTENEGKNADASFTNHPHRICAILTADCLPILICHKKSTHIAAIHAGWRGLASGIIEASIQALRQPAEQLLVWLGPAIGPTHFEVGGDVYEAFTTQHTESSHAFTPCGTNKWLANLYELAKIRLRLLGISQIYGGHYCTYKQSDLFFSYRRDKKHTGRMASVIWIES